MTCITGLWLTTTLASAQIQIEAVEITQSIQALSLSDPKMNNTVPLIKNKPTLVRMYLSTIGGIPGVIRGSIAVKRETGGGVIKVSDNALNLYSLGEGEMDLTAKRGLLHSSLNFVLHPDMVGGTEITIDSFGIIGTTITTPMHPNPPSCLNCDTFQAIHKPVFDPPALRVKLVGVQYVDQNGKWYSRPSGLDFARTRGWILRAYPVNPQQVEFYQGSTPADLGAFDTNLTYDGATCEWTNFFVSQYRSQDLNPGGTNLDLSHPLLRTHYVGLVSDHNPDGPPGNSEYFKQGCTTVVESSELDKFFWVGSAAVGPKGLNKPPWFGEDENGINDWLDKDGSYGDWYTGHELAHLLGVRHAAHQQVPNVCDAPREPTDPAYPYTGAQLSDADGLYVGLDMGIPKQVTMGMFVNGIAASALPGTVWHDMMSYCVRPWVSFWSFRKIFCRLYEENGMACPNFSTVNRNAMLSFPGAVEVSPEEPAMGGRPNFSQSPAPVNGRKNTTSLNILALVKLAEPGGIPEGKIQFISPVPGGVGDAEVQSKGLRDSRVRIQTLDEDGKTIDEVAALVPPTVPGTLPIGRSFLVTASIPYSGQVAKVELRSEGRLLDYRTPSPTPPVVTDINIEPVGGKKDVVLITWAASDNDGDKVTFNVQISLDRGKHWETVAVMLSRPLLLIEKDRLRGLPDAAVYVVASDGFKRKGLRCDAVPFPPNPSSLKKRCQQISPN